MKNQFFCNIFIVTVLCIRTLVSMNNANLQSTRSDASSCTSDISSVNATHGTNSQYAASSTYSGYTDSIAPTAGSATSLLSGTSSLRSAFAGALKSNRSLERSVVDTMRSEYGFTNQLVSSLSQTNTPKNGERDYGASSTPNVQANNNNRSLNDFNQVSLDVLLQSENQQNVSTVEQKSTDNSTPRNQAEPMKIPETEKMKDVSAFCCICR